MNRPRATLYEIHSGEQLDCLGPGSPMGPEAASGGRSQLIHSTPTEEHPGGLSRRFKFQLATLTRCQSLDANSTAQLPHLPRHAGSPAPSQ